MLDADHKRILVVDDQQAIHDAFRRVLCSGTQESAELADLEAALFGSATKAAQHHGDYDVAFAHQGEAAWDLQKSALEKCLPYSMAFVDMRMPPGWDGLETIEHLWASDPALQVVICTAYSDYSWEEIVSRLGATDRLILLKKPFANEEVFQLATALTEKWRLTKAANDQLEALRQANAQLQQEVGQRKLAEDQLRHEARHDRLTQLANRAALLDRIRRCIEKRQRNPDFIAALLFLDIDDFKFINDSLGHDVGDTLLIQIADRLKACSRPHDTLSRHGTHVTARLGGDEFVILVEDLTQGSDVVQIANRIQTELAPRFDLKGKDIHVSTSIGISMVDANIHTPDDLIRNADTAMYQAKAAGKRTFAIFDTQMHAEVTKRLELENALRGSTERDDFELYYQPIIQLETGRLVGFESLIRWNAPNRGWVAPDEFIPAAEETGLIVPIGRWILQKACSQLAEWNSRLPLETQLSISVNVSKRQFRETGFIEEIRELLHQKKIPGRCLNVEITESIVMDNPESIHEELVRLRDLGIRVHMDDFGTGHSSLSCLHNFPIDVLKVDQSFVSTMEAKSDYATIVSAIVALAHNLNCRVVAEGIETQFQLERLRELDCDYGQGFHFSKPLTASDIDQIIRESLMERPRALQAADLPVRQAGAAPLPALAISYVSQPEPA